MINKSFTLIELLIAVTIFSLVMIAASGIFVSSVRGQQRSLAFQEILAQTSYAIEYMSKALRMAQKDLTGDCLIIVGPKYNYETNPPERNRIRFLNYKNKCQEFFLEGNQIKERKSLDFRAANFGSALPLTSENIQVSAFNINLIGESQQDTIQPRVTIFLKVKGAGPKPEQQPEIKIQTTISQRNLDIKR